MYEIITTEEGVRRACEILIRSGAIGVDCETTDLTPQTGRMRLLQCAIPEKTFIFDRFSFDNSCALQPLASVFTASKPRKVFHNGKFDIKFLNEELGVEINGVYDTMLASQIISAGYREHKHGLDAVALRFIGQVVDKKEQLSKWDGALTKDQFNYAARDAEVLLPLRIEQSKQIKEKGLIKTAMIEFAAIQSLALVEMNGFPVHLDMYREIMKTYQNELDELGNELRELLGVETNQQNLFSKSKKVINLGSPLQVKEAYERIGVPMPNGTGAKEVRKLVRIYPQLQLLSDYRKIEKLLNGYGDKFIAQIDKTLWRIFCDFQQCGTMTGRLSCRDPNMQQSPRRKEYRACFRPYPDSNRCLIVADYSQLELRILAHLSGDENMIKGFNSGHDYHKATAMQLFGYSNPDDVSDEERTSGKTMNFSITYNQSPASTADALGISLKEAEALHQKYDNTYRGMRQYMNRTAERGLAEKMVRTEVGRIINLIYDEDDNQQRSHAERVAKNAPIQGLTGDILKSVLPDLTKHLKPTKAQIVNLVHDEIIVECDLDESEQVKQIMEERMTLGASEYIYEVPVHVKAVIAESWAEK